MMLTRFVPMVISAFAAFTSLSTSSAIADVSSTLTSERRATIISGAGVAVCEEAARQVQSAIGNSSNVCAIPNGQAGTAFQNINWESITPSINPDVMPEALPKQSWDEKKLEEEANKQSIDASGLAGARSQFFQRYGSSMIEVLETDPTFVQKVMFQTEVSRRAVTAYRIAILHPEPSGSSTRWAPARCADDPESFPGYALFLYGAEDNIRKLVADPVTLSWKDLISFGDVVYLTTRGPSAVNITALELPPLARAKFSPVCTILIEDK